MAIGFETPEDEKFYGFGERFGDCNQRGHRVGSWLEDGSFGLGVFDPDKWKLRVHHEIVVRTLSPEMHIPWLAVLMAIFNQ